MGKKRARYTNCPCPLERRFDVFPVNNGHRARGWCIYNTRAVIVMCAKAAAVFLYVSA